MFSDDNQERQVIADLIKGGLKEDLACAAPINTNMQIGITKQNTLFLIAWNSPTEAMILPLARNMEGMDLVLAVVDHMRSHAPDQIAPLSPELRNKMN